jgi:hypothetical protein
VPVPRRLAAGGSGIVPRASVSLALVLLRAVRAPLAAARVMVGPWYLWRLSDLLVAAPLYPLGLNAVCSWR